MAFELMAEIIIKDMRSPQTKNSRLKIVPTAQLKFKTYEIEKVFK